MPIPVTTINDGFDDPIRSTSNGDTKSASGNSESERTDKGSERIAGYESFDPFDAGTDVGNDQPRRRGRPKGSKNRVSSDTTKTTNNLIVDIESLLLSGHLMLASFTVPEMAIDPMEAKRLADAIKELGKHYAFGMDPKKFAWTQLILTAGSIYGPRAVAIYKRETAIPLASVAEKRSETVAQKATEESPIPIDRAKTQSVNGPAKTTSLAGLSPSQIWNEPPVPDQ